MTAAMGIPADTSYRRNVLILIGVLLVARVIGLFLSPLNLHGDEAQYWAWSKDLDFGYFSKPPMIAWAIKPPKPIRPASPTSMNTMSSAAWKR